MIGPAVDLSSSSSAEFTRMALMKTVSKEQAPPVLYTENGNQFTSKLPDHWFTGLDCSNVYIASHQAKSNGLAQHFICTLNARFFR